ncbi:cold-shock protein [Micromonospora auratinigra]|uniref:Cold shock protein, CspA family n=1 Tax=Micromonospora auratinigra TaxID=261654 RepID=A0A1A8ZD83_9ACTN|nr:cold shock domain-containing protein [Micromonospora auratinigra]SBT41814.1 Cold shock protein, CspA family [Micromonospora auratinigra]
MAEMAAGERLIRGRIVRFERAKGYGFIAPEGGGDDVFVHANELGAEGDEVRSGTAVEFKVLDSGRGPKAYDVRLLDPVRGVGPAAAPQPELGPLADDECDVLSERDFRTEVTEQIIRVAPSCTGQQIEEIRAGLCELARRHGWVV